MTRYRHTQLGLTWRNRLWMLKELFVALLGPAVVIVAAVAAVLLVARAR